MKKFIAPSILSADFTNLSQQIKYVEMGGADIIHCDIMDGKFVPNITFGPFVVEAVNRITNLPLDVHLMIENPDNYIDAFISAGADYITVHQETLYHLHRTIDYIKSKGIKAGVVINPATSVANIEEVLDIVDLILVMSVNPGYGGQKFIESTLNKIIKLDSIRKEKNFNYQIEIDGGISKNNILEVANKGCDIFVAGSSIFNSNNITASTLELKNLLNSIK